MAKGGRFAFAPLWLPSPNPVQLPLFLILRYFRLSLADLRPRLLLRRSPFPHMPGMGGSYRFYSTTQHHGAAEPEGHDASPRATSEPCRAPPRPQRSLKIALNRNKTARPPFFPHVRREHSGDLHKSPPSSSTDPCDKASRDRPAKIPAGLGGKRPCCRGVPGIGSTLCLSQRCRQFPFREAERPAGPDAMGEFMDPPLFPKLRGTFLLRLSLCFPPKTGANEGSPKEMLFITSNSQGVGNLTRNHQCF